MPIDTGRIVHAQVTGAGHQTFHDVHFFVLIRQHLVLLFHLGNFFGPLSHHRDIVLRRLAVQHHVSSWDLRRSDGADASKQKAKGKFGFHRAVSFAFKARARS